MKFLFKLVNRLIIFILSIKMWKYLDKYPPCLVRLMARRKVGPSKRAVEALSNQEIAVSADISVEEVASISMDIGWNNVTIGQAKQFCAACNFDPFNSMDRNRASAYLRAGAPFRYLAKHPHWETFFKPLIMHLKHVQATQKH